MWSAKTGTGKAKSAIGFLYSKDNSETNLPWRVRGIRDMFENTVGNDFKIPNSYSEKTDLVMAVKGEATGDDVSATFQLQLVKSTV